MNTPTSNNKKLKSYSLTIGWLYPELMSTYGDRGNIFVLKNRCNWRNIEIEVLPIDESISLRQLEQVDILFGGGSQDREQEIVMRDLRGSKGDILKNRIEKNIPALFVCGSPQLMGMYYEPARGKRLDGVGIFDMITKHPEDPNSPRLIGNVVAEVFWENLKNGSDTKPPSQLAYIVGFENHGGRTYLGDNAKPFARIVLGNGNNGEDGTEGVVYKNAIGCYFHGPLLPKNPHIADLLIRKALETKYQEEITLSPLDDSLEIQANHSIVNRLGIKI